MQPSLFDDLPASGPSEEWIADGAVVLRGRVLSDAPALWQAVQTVAAAAPWRHMETPGGRQMNIAMTNCGAQGWVSDRHGYRYSTADPVSGEPWPAMPERLRQLASDLAAQAGFEGFEPDACLINLYRPGQRLTLHQDRDEQELRHPIVSLSLGLPATFLFGGLSRSGPQQRITLMHGDAVVWGGAARLRYHGIAPLRDGTHALTGDCRINLTLRRAG